MLDVFNTAKPTGCDIQTFYGERRSSGSSTANSCQRVWNKPRGVSHVYILLIGGGGSGDGASGGGSGAVTVWYGAAQNIPDSLIVVAGQAINTTVNARVANSALTPAALLIATTATSTSGAGASSAPVFASSGFYQSTAGQAGSTGNVNPSATTFLSGGGFSGNTVTANYGYKTGTDGNGFFQMQPIIIGVGAAGGFDGGYGCGGGYAGQGGPGLVLIASW